MALPVTNLSDEEFFGTSAGGPIERGNIDLNARPVVRNPNGSISTVLSRSYNFDGREVLLPTVSDDGRIMDDNETVSTYRRTGKHLGVFNDPGSANKYAQQLHESQAAHYLPASKAPAANGVSDAEFFGGGAAPVIPAGMDAPTETVVARPQAALPQDVSPLSRLFTNMQHSFQNFTIQGLAGRLIDSTIQSGVRSNLERWGYKENAADYRAATRDYDPIKKAYEGQSAWHDQPTLWGKVVHGAAAAGGEMGGQLFTPEALLAPGEEAVTRYVAPKIAKYVGDRAAAPISRIVGAGAGQAAVNAGTDPLIQGGQIALGGQDNYDPMQTLLAGPLGFGMGAVLRGGPELLRGAWDAFHGWRAKNGIVPPAGADPAAPPPPPTPEESAAFAASDEMAAFLAANGLTDPNSPAAQKLEQRVQSRRAVEAHPLGFASREIPLGDITGGAVDTNQGRVRLPTGPEPGAPRVDLGAEMARASAEIQARRDLAQELDQGAAAQRDLGGILQDGRDPATVGLPVREPLPDVIPVTPAGQADVGGLGTAVARDKFGARGGLPVATEPQPARATPEDITRSQAKMYGGNENKVEPPPRYIVPEDRLPQTPEQVQEQRLAGDAMTKANIQRGKVAPGVRDVQPGGRPQGADQQPIILDDGFPVQEVGPRSHVEVNGKTVEVAQVHRYDPRTGALDPEAVPYSVPVKQLKAGKYAVEPRQAQDVTERSKGPEPIIEKGDAEKWGKGAKRGAPEQPRMPDEGVRREPAQTYRADTRPDDNTEFPDAGEGRTPFPEQPEGPHPGRDRSRNEEEAIRDYQRREQARQRQDWGGPGNSGAKARDYRKTDDAASTTAKAPDADGRFEVDDRGYVTSDKGGPMKFADQKQAAKWIINHGHKKSPDQIFEIENHPSGKGFGVRERGRAEAKAKDEPPPAGGGTEPPRRPSPDSKGGADGASAADGRLVNPGALPPPREAPPAKAAKAAKAEAPNSETPSETIARTVAEGRAELDRNAADRAAAQAARAEKKASLDKARADIAAHEKANAPKPRGDGSLFDRIRELGGIRNDPDVKEIMQSHPGERFKSAVMRPDGKSPDEIRRALQEEGWFGGEDRFGADARETGSYRGDDLQDLYDLLDKEARGEKQFHPGRQTPDREHTYQAQRDLDEEIGRTDINPGDSPAVKARKLAEYREKLAADDAAHMAKRDQALDVLSDREIEEIYGQGFQPEGEAGTGAQEPGGAGTYTRQSDDLPGWEDGDFPGDHPHQGDDRQSGTGAGREGPRDQAERREPAGDNLTGRHDDARQTEIDAPEATREDLKRRQAERDAEERQQNPRAHSGKRQKGHDESGLFAEEDKQQGDIFDDPDAKEKLKAADDLKTTFTSNPITDPRVWRELGRTLSDTFGWLKNSAAIWAEDMGDSFARFGVEKPKGETLFQKTWDATRPMRTIVGYLHASLDGRLRNLGANFKTSQKTLEALADEFNPVSRGGRGGAKRQGYFDAELEHRTQWQNRYQKAMAPFVKMRKAQRAEALPQIGKQVQNPGSIRRGTPIGDAAHEMRTILKEVHDYLKEAGVDVGFIKNYWPRILDTQRVLADKDGFIAAATRAYMADGISRRDAAQAAQDWYERAALKNEGVGEGMSLTKSLGGVDPFTKSRKLGPRADEIMGDFFQRNPADVIPAYINKAVAMAEWSRRFGKRDRSSPVPRGENAVEWYAHPEGKWEDYKARLRAEGNEDLIPSVTHIVRVIAGTDAGPKGANGILRVPLSMGRTITSLSFLPLSTFINLAEPMVIAVRTGNLLDSARAYADMVHQTIPLLRNTGGAKYLREFASDLGIIGDSYDESALLARAAGDGGDGFSRKITSRFFRANLLTQLTEKNRIASVKAGAVFIRRLAKDVSEGNHYSTLSRRLLAELGIGAETMRTGGNGPPGEDGVQRFAQYVMDLDKPTKADLDAHGEFGDLYQKALGKFVSDTVMHPNRALKPEWASHPVGGLIFGITSYSYAFQKNVLNRVGAMTLDALNPASGLNAQERLAAMVPMMALVPLAAVSYALVQAKRELTSTDAQREAASRRPPPGLAATAVDIASRSSLTGTLDPQVQAVGSFKYQTSAATQAAGPVLGSFLTLLDDVRALMGDRNSPNTNYTERKLASDTYKMIVQPTLETGVLMGADPRVRALGWLGRLATFGLGSPQAREAFTTKVAGPRSQPKK